MLGSKGQEEAPFSLLLAVAMIAMVIPIAFYLFTQLQQSQCQSQIQNDMETFARELELATTLGGGQRIVDVALTTCANIQVDNFTLKDPGTDVCQEACHDPNCRLLSTSATRFEGDEAFTGPVTGLSPVCIRVPLNVQFTTEECEAGTLPIGEAIVPGVHRLVLTKVGYTVKVCEKAIGEE
jgi:type II secretory pathway pseudopilin PulG